MSKIDHLARGCRLNPATMNPYPSVATNPAVVARRCGLGSGEDRSGLEDEAWAVILPLSRPVQAFTPFIVACKVVSFCADGALTMKTESAPPSSVMNSRRCSGRDVRFITQSFGAPVRVIRRGLHASLQEDAVCPTHCMVLVLIGATVLLMNDPRRPIFYTFATLPGCRDRRSRLGRAPANTNNTAGAAIRR